MSIIIPVLKDNNDLTILKEKLEEEHEELMHELGCIRVFEKAQIQPSSVAIEKLVGEAMDAIQVVTGIIDTAIKKDREASMKAIHGHTPKLLNRGWDVERVLVVQED